MSIKINYHNRNRYPLLCIDANIDIKFWADFRVPEVLHNILYAWLQM